MRCCVIFNPAAKGDKARRFRRHLDEIRAGCVLKQTVAAGDARRLATEAVREGFVNIIAAGGDGTLNEVLNGIGDAPDGFANARLGLLPLGTVNVFARELRIPTRLELAWQVIQQGHETTIDLPSVEYSCGGTRTRRFFAQLAGAGLDARAIEFVHWPIKKRFGSLAYVLAGLKALFGRQSQITITGADSTASGELVLVGNGRWYGGPFHLFPRADLRDGLLEVCVVRRAGWLTLLRCGPGLLLGRPLAPTVAENFQLTSFTLVSDSRVPVEVDGELIGQLPATFSVQRSRLRVIVPRPRE